MLRIDQPGLLTSVQDAGRPGSAHLGIGPAGAADGPALRLANALVGNEPDAAGLEITLAGPEVRIDTDAIIALTGAPLPYASLNGAPVAMWQRHPVPAGSRLAMGPLASGCRSYLAISGGITLPAWRGSRSTDVNAGLGPLPRALTDNDSLPLDCAGHAADPEDPGWSLDPAPWFRTTTTRTLRLLPGSHTHQLQPAAHTTLTEQPFTIGNDSNRVGVRLDGTTLALSESLQMVSEGVAAGVVQLPPDGRPVIMGPEHPVTGGYPRIAQVAGVDLPELAQCRPGDTLRFEWLTPDAAQQQLDEQERALTQLVHNIDERLRST